jgi:hypothetical protein
MARGLKKEKSGPSSASGGNTLEGTFCFENCELSLRQTNELSTDGLENMYRVRFYAVSYV